MAPFTTNIAPWLTVRDAEAAMDFHERAFGAVQTWTMIREKGATR